jgi:hypothetical protein
MNNIKCQSCGVNFKSFKRKKYCENCLLKNRRKNVLESSRKRMIRNREFVKNYKEGRKCELCGYNNYPQLLEFHHKNRKEKTNGVNLLMKTLKNLRIIEEEIKKCRLLCANCHKELHLKEGYKK